MPTLRTVSIPALGVPGFINIEDGDLEGLASLTVTDTLDVGGVATFADDAEVEGDLILSGDLNGVTLPVDVTGERDDPESALANLLTALASLGLITDSTTETTV